MMIEYLSLIELDVEVGSGGGSGSYAKLTDVGEGRQKRTATLKSKMDIRKMAKREFFQILRVGIPKYLYSGSLSLGDQATTCRFVRI